MRKSKNQMPKIDFYVSKKIIEESRELLKNLSLKPIRATHCPIATAISNKIGTRVMVSPRFMLEYSSEQWEVFLPGTYGMSSKDIKLPPRAAEFAKRFDDNEDVIPIHFYVNIPQEYINT